MEKNTIFLQDTSGNSERTRQRNLACLGNQSQSRIQFILPVHRASHLIEALAHCPVYYLLSIIRHDLHFNCDYFFRLKRVLLYVPFIFEMLDPILKFTCMSKIISLFCNICFVIMSWLGPYLLDKWIYRIPGRMANQSCSRKQDKIY